MRMLARICLLVSIGLLCSCDDDPFEEKCSGDPANLGSYVMVEDGESCRPDEIPREDNMGNRYCAALCQSDCDCATVCCVEATDEPVSFCWHYKTCH